MSYSAFLETLISLILQVALLIATAHAINQLIDRDSTKNRVWKACYFLTLMLTIRAFLFPRIRLFHPWSLLEVPQMRFIGGIEFYAGCVILSVWAVGMIASLCSFLWSWYLARRFFETCDLLPMAALPESVQTQLSQESDPPIFLSSNRIVSPFCWQIHQPYIVLPEFLLDFDSHELHLIIRHELEHLRTGDPLSLFIQRIAEIVFWFHPVVWWSSRQAALAKEYACDVAATQSKQDVCIYLRSLLKIVERQNVEADPTHGLAFGRGKGMVANRAARLVMLARSQSFVEEQKTKSLAIPLIVSVAIFLTLLGWLPLDVMGSQITIWSAWPTWSAKVMHTVGINARDFERNVHPVEWEVNNSGKN